MVVNDDARARYQNGEFHQLATTGLPLLVFLANEDAAASS